MKKIFLSLIMLFNCLVSFASKKSSQKQYITYISGTYSYNNGIRKVGNVYELTIQTLANNIVVDSVWFGNTPVPCDMLETKTKHKIDTAKQKGIYIVRANKNLYENFYEQIDSTLAFKKFKASQAFKGEAMIMYKLNGKRYYKSVNKVKKINPKGYRN